jgi:hypothetical protein
MKTAKFLLAAIFFAVAVGIGTSALAEDGLNDSHGVWRGAEYWHANHPEWVYRYHPEWAVDRQEWWLADHRGHPGWFESPYWRRYPVWTYGAYDRGHVWRDAGWWRGRDPGWFYAHHPEWAEAHPGWIRDDHGRHPEWFHSGYWGEHPRDWNHPGEEYRRELSRNVEYQHSHSEGSAVAHGGVYHGGVAVDRDGEHNNASARHAEHSNAAAGQYHASAAHSSTYHPASTYHASSPVSSASHSSGGGGGHHGKH